MKKTTQSITFLALGILFFASCSEEKSGEVAELMPEKISIEKEKVSSDEITKDEVKVNQIPKAKTVPPPPPEPEPWPDPDPRPPHPKPWPFPEPPPPMPMPEPVIEIPAVEAQFPGGVEELKKYLANAIVYPTIDKELNNQGRVYVQFVVENDGSITSIEVKKGVSESIDREAKHVIRAMPKWKPAEDGGKIVRSRMTVPIVFSLL